MFWLASAAPMTVTARSPDSAWIWLAVANTRMTRASATGFCR